jgi:hypothetical protein
MAGYRHEPDSGDELAGGPVRQNLKATRSYGCLFATLLGGSMSFVVLLGNVMGDCSPGPGCHDNDGVHIMKDLAVALPIAAVLGAGVWLLAAAIRASLQPIIGERLVILLLVALTLALVWFGSNPAMETFFQWTRPGY